MSKLAARYALFEIFRAEGVRFIFGNPGTTETPFLDTLVEYRDIKYVLGLHESAVIAIADGFARATGYPSVVSIHAVPGTANALSSLYNALRDRTPMVVVAGQQPQRILSQDPPLAGDTVAMARPVVKWAWEVSNAAELPLVLRRAFHIARVPPRGPVLLSLPRDILEGESEFSIERYRPSEEWIMTGHVDAVEKAAVLLARAENPLILAGPGLSLGAAWRPLAETAEYLGAPIYASPVGFPARHPQVCGLLGWDLQTFRKALADADLIFMAAYRSIVNDPYEPLIVPGTSIIQVDDDPWEIGKKIAPSLSVCGELSSALSLLRDLLKKEGKDKEGKDKEGTYLKRREKTLALSEASRIQADTALKAKWNNVPISPARAIAALDALLPEDAIVIDEAVRASGYVKRHLQHAGPGRYFYYDGGALGWGIGMAVGTQMALPDRRVVAVVGDGAAVFGIHSLWTAARWNLPIMVVILDNRSYAAVVAALSDYKGEAFKKGIYPGCDVVGVDFPALASGLGVPSRTVLRPDELEPAFGWGLNLNGPGLVHVSTDPSDLGPGHPGRPS